MERKIVATMEPSWHDELSELDEMHGALGADSLSTARRIRQPIETADDILNVFDGITYAKGASVLNMFESYLGPELFQRGVRQYIADRAFGAATSSDFVAAISKAAGRDLGPAFASFLEQSGAPEITATIACTKGEGAGAPARATALRAAGRTTAPAREHAVKLADAGLLRLRSQRRARERVHAARQADRADHAVVGRDHDGVGNRGAARVPAVGDAERRRARLLPQRADRAAGRRVARRGVADADVDRAPRGVQRRRERRRARQAAADDLAMSFVPKLLRRRRSLTIGDAIGLPSSLDGFVPDALRGGYHAWLRRNFAPAAIKLGMMPRAADDIDAESVRRQLVGVAAHAGTPQLIADAVKLAAKWRDLPSSARGAVVSIAADASADVFAQLLKDVRTEHDRARRRELFGALAGVSDLGRQRQALELVLDPALDARETLWMLYGGRTEANHVQAREFARAHVKEILARFPKDSTTGGGQFAGVFTGACRADQRDDIVAFVNANFSQLPGAKHELEEQIEELDQCIARRAILEPEIRGWLGGVKANAPDPPTGGRGDAGEERARRTGRRRAKAAASISEVSTGDRARARGSLRTRCNPEGVGGARCDHAKRRVGCVHDGRAAAREVRHAARDVWSCCVRRRNRRPRLRANRARATAGPAATST